MNLFLIRAATVGMAASLWMLLTGCESKLSVKTSDVAPNCQETNTCPVDDPSTIPDDASTDKTGATAPSNGGDTSSRENLSLGFERLQYQTLSVKRLNYSTGLAIDASPIIVAINSHEMQCALNKNAPDLFAGTVKTMIDPTSQYELLSALSYGTNNVTISLISSNLPDNQTTQSVTLRDFEMFDWSVLASDAAENEGDASEGQSTMSGWIAPYAGIAVERDSLLTIGFGDSITH